MAAETAEPFLTNSMIIARRGSGSMTPSIEISDEALLPEYPAVWILRFEMPKILMTGPWMMSTFVILL